MKVKVPYLTGYRAEKTAMAQLKGEGFEVMRSAGSHGFWDIVAYNRRVVRFIQLKVIGTGEKRIFSKLRDDLALVEMPPYVVKELWISERRRGWHYYII
jgi:Holliday junction resolvase